jgi:outer membrane putative beta-barrel porin/alpha-amylase
VSVLFRLSPILLSLACAIPVDAVLVASPNGQVDPAHAGTVQNDVPPVTPIAPDRPDVTNGTNIVEEGLLQIEVGVQHVRMGTQHSAGTPVTFRVGLFEWLEARAGTDGFLHQSDNGSSVSGAGNVQLGAKLRLFADPGGAPVLSILPTINLPVASASKGLGSGDLDTTLVVLTGTDVGRTSHLDVNYGVGAIGAGLGHPHFFQQLVSASFSHSLTEQLSPYIEGFWFSRQDPDGGPVVSIDAGFIQAFDARFAIDGGIAVGLTNAAPDFSVFTGLSIIIGDVLGDHGVIARQRKAARLHSRTPR